MGPSIICWCLLAYVFPFIIQNFFFPVLWAVKREIGRVQTFKNASNEYCYRGKVWKNADAIW